MIRWRRLPTKYLKLLLLLALLGYGLVTIVYVPRSDDFLQRLEHHLQLESLPLRIKATTTKTGVRRHKVSKNWTIQNACPIHSLPRKIGHSVDSNPIEKIKCKPHAPSNKVCIFVKSFYAYQFQKWSCGDDGDQVQICKLDNQKNTFVCDYTQCGAFFKGRIMLHVFDPRTGRTKQLRQGLKSTTELNNNIMKYIKTVLKTGFNFIFLSCGTDPYKTQLIPLNPTILGIQPRRLHGGKTVRRGRKEKQISINFLFIDSLSRGHFYRSLKKTVSYFKSLNTKSSSDDSGVEVLDFESFQSIHGHTTENLLGLMTGTIFPKTTTEQEKEVGKTQFPTMLKFMKEHGYKTLYQEDQCWQGIWGLNSDLGLFQTDWKTFYKEVKDNSFIDDTGLTFAACKIVDLHEPKNKHVFNTDEKICYNGLNMDTYYLDYSSERIQHSEGPLFSFTTLVIAHDPTGHRVQGIDQDLKRYIQKVSKSSNTLTIIFSDHGSTYNNFVYTDIEGRYEMFHPSLFMVVPKGVEKKLGKQAMDALRKNQKRLLTLVDIHHTIKHIADNNHKNKGVLQTLPANRTCADIPMAMPNLCVCNGWDSPVENTTELMPYVEFSVGHINNMISAASPNMKCKRLVPTSFQNAMQRKNGDDVILKFDVFTSAGPGSENSREQITIEVIYKISNIMSHFDTKLISYDRISRFGPYRECSDANRKFRFCVCDMVNKEKKELLLGYDDLSPVRNEYVYEIFGEKRVDEVIHDIVADKMGLLARKTFDVSSNLVTVTFEAISITENNGKAYEIRIEFSNLENMKTLTNKKCKGVLQPRSMTYLCTLARKWSIYEASYTYKIFHKKM